MADSKDIKRKVPTEDVLRGWLRRGRELRAKGSLRPVCYEESDREGLFVNTSFLIGVRGYSSGAESVKACVFILNKKGFNATDDLDDTEFEDFSHRVQSELTTDGSTFSDVKWSTSSEPSYILSTGKEKYTVDFGVFPNGDLFTLFGEIEARAVMTDKGKEECFHNLLSSRRAVSTLESNSDTSNNLVNYFWMFEDGKGSEYEKQNLEKSKVVRVKGASLSKDTALNCVLKNEKNDFTTEQIAKLKGWKLISPSYLTSYRIYAGSKPTEGFAFVSSPPARKANNPTVSTDILSQIITTVMSQEPRIKIADVAKDSLCIAPQVCLSILVNLSTTKVSASYTLPKEVSETIEAGLIQTRSSFEFLFGSADCFGADVNHFELKKKKTFTFNFKDSFYTVDVYKTQREGKSDQLLLVCTKARSYVLTPKGLSRFEESAMLTKPENVSKRVSKDANMYLFFALKLDSHTGEYVLLPNVGCVFSKNIDQAIVNLGTNLKLNSRYQYGPFIGVNSEENKLFSIGASTNNLLLLQKAPKTVSDNFKRQREREIYSKV